MWPLRSRGEEGKALVTVATIKKTFYLRLPLGILDFLFSAGDGGEWHVLLHEQNAARSGSLPGWEVMFLAGCHIEIVLIQKQIASTYTVR